MVTKTHIRKERIKFSSAHMTVFDDGTKENLHGHNYETELTLETKKMVPFDVFKAALEKITAQWDEKVLLAKRNRHFKELTQTKETYSFSLCGKQYALPLKEVILLPIDNSTSEALSQELLKEFLKSLPLSVKKQLRNVTLRIDESRGQGASTTWSSK